MNALLTAEGGSGILPAPSRTQMTADNHAQQSSDIEPQIINQKKQEKSAIRQDSISLHTESSTHKTFNEIEENMQKSFKSLINSVINTSVEFTTDEATDSSYIKITDKATNELLRTIPSEAMRNVLENIHEHIDELLNNNLEGNRGHLLDTNS